ncbi:hypothetical protein KDL01_32710 [Actinospica durhamensis]|uniref:DUF3558 domain-containing protein n=1 Tax=Actinospica durhamensis TaxID=1508375 RepID=A0A941EVL3_9ACTN|nr:hypothetical protein [Actinospica durhamensis]MBR7838081.1 hypothetical protein [Actinospica durhamensis]
MPRRPLIAACTLTLAVPLALCSLSACADPGSGAATTPAAGSGAGTGATPSSVAVADSSALITDLGQAGHTCTAATGAADTVAMPGLRNSLNCVISGAGRTGSADATVAVFDDHAHAAAFANVLTSSNVSGLLLGGTSERAVLGSNWVVLVPDDASYADAVHAALGGTVLDGGTSTASAGASSGG